MATVRPDKTILVVEDDDLTRAGFAAALSERGYCVGMARNGQEALDYLDKSAAPYLIILDMILSDVDGWQFLKRLRARAMSIPILVCTSIGIASDAWATSLGACCCLQKPIDPEAMLERVERCLRGCKAG